MIEEFFDVGGEMLQLDREVMEECRGRFEEIGRLEEYNQMKVHRAFIDCGISSSHLVGTTGYGHDDKGRDGLDRLFARIFGAEDAICRHNFTSGTHTIATALFGVLRTGDRMVCATGTPYDTLHGVIGIDGSHFGNLMDYGVEYEEVALKEDSSPDLERIRERCRGARVCYIQRSRGYSSRKALSLGTIKEIADAARRAQKDIIVMVDNCYGEFTQTTEPVRWGADLIMGSLIKNPGGGIAPTGGYIAGRHDLVELCGHRLTAPGTGREIGCTLDVLRQMYLGIYMAPTVTAAALRASVYASCLYEKLGFVTEPRWFEDRNDIITAIEAGSAENVIAICRRIQANSAIDSFAYPEPGEMAGYGDKIIMASGSFTMGSSIELSCDAPIRPPYTAFMQGGTTFPAARAAILMSARAVRGKN